MQKCRASITQTAPDDAAAGTSASARAQTELHCRDDVRYWLKQAVLKGSLVPTLPQINKRLTVIRKMEPQRIDYHFVI
jgi:hypothetical protein